MIILFQEFFSRPDMVSDLQRFCQSKGADIMVLMTLSTSSTGVPERQLAVFSENRIYRQQVIIVEMYQLNFDCHLLE